MADTLKDLKKSTTTKKGSSTSSTSVPARHYESIAHFAAANKAMSYKKKKTRDRHMAEVDAKDWTIQGAEKSSDELFRKTPNVREYTVTPSARQTTSTGTGRAGASGTSQRGNNYTESRERLDALLTQKSGKPANDPASRTTGGRTAQQEKLDQYMNRLKQVNAASKRPEEPKSTTAPDINRQMGEVNGERQATGANGTGFNEWMDGLRRKRQQAIVQGDQNITDVNQRIVNAQRPIVNGYTYGSFANNDGTVNEGLQAGNVEATTQDMRWLIGTGFYNKTAGTDYNLMNAAGRASTLNNYRQKAQYLENYIPQLEAKVAEGQAKRPQSKEEYDAWREASMPTILGIYHTPETKNERTILARENASDAEKRNAQNTLDQLLYDDRDENGDSAYDRATNLMMEDTEQLRDMWAHPEKGGREDVRRYVYDYMNGDGAYERDMAELDSEGKDTLREEINGAVEYLFDTDYQWEEKLRTAQAELRYTQGEVGKLERLTENDQNYGGLFAAETSGDVEYHEENDRTIGATMGATTEADRVYNMLSGEYDQEGNFAGLYNSGAGTAGLALMMDQKERDHFLSLYNDQRYDEALAFFEALKPTLTQFGNVWEEQYLRQQATTNPVTSSLMTVGAHVLQVPEAVYGELSRLAGDKNAYDPYGENFALTRYKTGIRANVGENIQNTGLGKAGKVVYDAIMSGADSWANLHLWNFAGGSKVQQLGSLAMFFAQAYETDLQQNMIESHGDYNRSRVAAFLNAAIETGTEVVSIEALMSDPTNLRQWVTKVLVSESGEEVEGAAFGPLINEIVLGSNEWKERAVQIVGQGGYTDEEGNWISVDNYDDAWRIASSEWLHDIFLSGVSGALSVLGSAGYGIVQNGVQRSQFRSIGKNVGNYQQGSMQMNGTAGEVTRGPQLQQMQTEQDVINNPQLDAGTQQQEQAQRQQAAEGLKGVSQETTEEKKSGTDMLLEAAGKLKSDSRSAQLADSIRDDQNWGRKVSDRKIGELAVTVAQESNEEARGIARDVMAETATGKLVDSGMGQGESWVLGQAISKAVSSEEGLDALSKAERKKLEASEQGMAVFNEMNSWAGQEENAEATALQEKIGAKSRAQAEAMGLVEEVAGYDNAKVNAKRATNADVGEQLATEEEIKEAGGNATRSSDEVLVDGAFAKITGMEAVEVEDENGQKRTQIRYTINQNGQERTVTAGEVKATNFATAALLRENEGNSYRFGARYTQKMLEQMQRGNVTDVSRFMMSAERIRFAAYAGMDMPKTSLPQSVAFELYQASLEEHRDAMAEEAKKPSLVKNARGAGNGIARFDGVEYGTAEWNKKIKNVKNPSQRAQIQLVARVAKAMGAEVTITRNNKQVDVYGYESQQEIGLNLSGKNFSNGQAAESHSIVVGFGHEATHWLQRNAPEAYRKLRTYVLDTLQKQGKDVGLEVQKMFEDRSRNENITIDGAIDEIVADACDQILGQEETVRHIQQTDQKLAGKLREFVRDLVDRFKKAIAGMPDSASEYSRLMKDNMNELVRLWTGAYDEALSAKAQENAQQQGTVRQSRASLTEEELQKQIERDNKKYIGISLSENSKAYDYDFLVGMHPIQITKEVNMDGIIEGKEVDHSELIKQGKANAIESGGVQEKNGRIRFKNEYTGRYLYASSNSIDHGTHSTENKLSNVGNAKAGILVGELAKHGIPINGLKTVKTEKTKLGEYAIAAPMVAADGKKKIAVLTVEIRTGDITKAELYDQIHSTSARKKNEAGQTPSGVTSSWNSPTTHSSRISIKELLEVVNSTHQGLLSQNVLDRFGEERPMTGYWGPRAKFSRAAMNQQYAQAVERGNVQRQQELVDERAEEAFAGSKVRGKDGKLLKVFHGTRAEFNEFRRDKIGSTGRFEGSGFNFTPYEDRAASYGGNVLGGYLNIQKPLSAEKKTISIGKLAQLIREADPTGDYIISDYARNTRDYGSESFVRRESMTAARSVWESSDNDVDIYSFISAADSDAESLIETFSGMGYDGVIHYDSNGNIKTAVAFNSEQFKKADPVTYDDNGNMIPLDERFDTKKADIRWSRSVRSESGEKLAEITEGGTVSKYSRASWTQKEIATVRKNLLKKGFTEKQVDKWIKDANSIAAKIASDTDRWDFIPDRDQKFKKPNGDVYAGRQHAVREAAAVPGNLQRDSEAAAEYAAAAGRPDRAGEYDARDGIPDAVRDLLR